MCEWGNIIKIKFFMLKEVLMNFYSYHGKVWDWNVLSAWHVGLFLVIA